MQDKALQTLILQRDAARIRCEETCKQQIALTEKENAILEATTKKAAKYKLVIQRWTDAKSKN
jgi:hypothetical protein